jgi:4-carboxymuconolactone decarboxylase
VEAPSTAADRTPRLAPLEPPHPAEAAAHLAALMPKGWAGPALALFRLWARHLPMAEALRGVGRYLLAHGTLPARDRELLILRSCARCDAEYEWGVHAAFFPARVGLDAATVDATRMASPADVAGPQRVELADADCLLLRAADELHDGATLSDATWAALSARFDETQLLELPLVCGFYHLVSYTANATRIRPEPFAARFPARGGA